jgi:adenosylcobinamide kinase/adenosylcobinamide-phosphate guanylyltransferase
MKVLVTGGARSGKSRFALELAQSLSPARYYIATAQALDAEMDARIAAHRRERGPGWTTVEEPLEIARCLAQPGPVVVDCLTLWLTNLLMRERSDAEIVAAIEQLVEAFDSAKNPVIAITNEVGMGIVPDNALARRFRDLAGISSQRLARVADRVVLMCAGFPLEVKSS